MMNIKKVLLRSRKCPIRMIWNELIKNNDDIVAPDGSSMGINGK
jgi:hypothetical protein